MIRLDSILIFLLLTTSIVSLHLLSIPNAHQSAQSQLQVLRAQQLSFEYQVNTLIGNISELDSKVKSSQNTSQKVILLENAIISEREKVFDISNSLIPPFNLSKTACKQLTNQQKINLLDQVSAARKSVADMKALSSTIPPCKEVQMINTDLHKQTVLLDSIEKAIYTKCDSSIILSATIFQSNIYAPNWILGNQTIDDLIEEYYQRSVQYDNITNCPLEYPFFDGNQCIQCKGNLPIFNMLKKTCDVCPYDTQLNQGLRKCQQIPHYSDYSKANNYNLDGASGLPAPDSTLTPCPAKTPFWNGACINCPNGKWWSVKDNVCKSCTVGQAFDVNLKSCVKPSGTNFLTILQGTQWVTSPGNFTQVLKERADLLNNNKNAVQYCSSDSPYFDGLQCIKCDNQFDLNTKTCVSAPPNSAYDANIHAFALSQSNKETNSKAPNVLASAPLTDDPKIPNCDISKPYYDGIACISCPQPFILFDTSSKKCVVCEAGEIYNNKTLKCQPRAKVLISTNFNRLLATPSQSVEQYKKQLLDKVQNNKDEIVDRCTNANDYSNFSACFPCSDSEYFNVQTKACVTCNGTYNATSARCVPKNTFITNLSTPSLLLSTKKTISDYQKEQGQILGPVLVCPSATPYAVGGLSCIACSSPTAYFDLQLNKCVACPENSFYNSKSLICEKGQFVSNLTAITKYIEVDNYTIANIQKQIDEIAKTKPIIKCGSSTPFFDGTKCNSCPNNTYVNLKNFSCISSVEVANTAVLSGLKNVFEQDNHTVANLANQIKSMKVPTVTCNTATPAFNGKECYSCPTDKYYKLKTNQCVSSVTASNIAQLKKLNNLKETDNYTLANIEKQEKASQFPVVPCNSLDPLFDGKSCISCDSYGEYDLKTLKCIPPQLYTNTTALKTLKYIETANHTLLTIDAADAKIPLPKKPCPAEAPLFNTKQCIACTNGAFYNLETFQCINAVTVTNVDALKKSNTFLEVDNYTIANIQKEIQGSKLPTVPCDASKPLYDGKTCLACPSSLYNLKLNSCVNCSITDQYDSKTNKCVPKPNYYPNLSNNNWVVNDASGVDRLINFTLSRKNLDKSLPCPQGKQFFNNKTYDCQSCPKGQQFNYDSFACVACAAGQQVDPNTHVCSTKMAEGLFQTNLNSPDLIYNGVSSGQLQQNYDNNKSKYPNIKDCPADKPNFDGYACIKCHPYVQYFNVGTKICQNCGSDGATYSSELHDCVKERQVINTSPNPAKMYSSIF